MGSRIAYTLPFLLLLTVILAQRVNQKKISILLYTAEWSMQDDTLLAEVLQQKGYDVTVSGPAGGPPSSVVTYLPHLSLEEKLKEGRFPVVLVSGGMDFFLKHGVSTLAKVYLWQHSATLEPSTTGRSLLMHLIKSIDGIVFRSGSDQDRFLSQHGFIPSSKVHNVGSSHNWTAIATHWQAIIDGTAPKFSLSHLDLVGYVINTPNSVDRLKRMEDRLNNLSIPLERVVAVPLDDAEIETMISSFNLVRELGIIKRLSLFFSHRNALRLASQRDGYSIILEDDAMFQRSFAHRLDAVINNAPLGWKVIMLGAVELSWHGRHFVGKDPSLNNLYSTPGNWLAHAYLVRSDGAKALLEKYAAYQEGTKRADLYLSELPLQDLQPTGECIVAYPYMSMQEFEDSQLQDDHNLDQLVDHMMRHNVDYRDFF